MKRLISDTGHVLSILEAISISSIHRDRIWRCLGYNFNGDSQCYQRWPTSYCLGHRLLCTNNWYHSWLNNFHSSFSEYPQNQSARRAWKYTWRLWADQHPEYRLQRSADIRFCGESWCPRGLYEGFARCLLCLHGRMYCSCNLQLAHEGIQDCWCLNQHAPLS